MQERGRIVQPFNRKRWAQFSLGSLLLLVVVAATLLGWWRDRRSWIREAEQQQGMIEALRSARDGPVEDVAIEHVERVEHNLQSVDEFIRALRSAESWRSFEDDVAIPFLRSKIAAEAIPALLRLLEDQNADIRTRALYTLGQTGERPEVVVPAVARMLNDEDTNVRWQAAHALGEFGPAAEAAVPALVEAMRDQMSPIRAFAANTLRRVDPEIDVVPDLIELLSHENARERTSAVMGLSRIGNADARKTLPALVELLDDNDGEVRLRAAQAVGNMMPSQKALPILVEAFQNENDQHIRNEMARVIDLVDAKATAQSRTP